MDVRDLSRYQVAQMSTRQVLVPLLCLISWPASAVEPSCFHPDLDRFLEQSRAAIHFDGRYFPSASAKFLPFDADGRHLQWLGVSWEGPPDGALFVLDCEGRTVAAVRLGYVQALRKSSVVPGVGQAFEVIYTSAVGAGEHEETVDLVSFEKDAIAVVWSHEASESVSAPSLKVEYSDRFSWQFDENGGAINVAGERKVGGYADGEHGWAANSSHELPNESFCLSPADKIYKACVR